MISIITSFCSSIYFYACIGLIACFCVTKYIKNKSNEKKWAHWSQKSKHKVIIHGMYGNNKALPSASPFVMKLETYLRMAKIPFEIDKTTPWGPKGKTPWLSAHGVNISDSQLCVEYLQKKFETKLNRSYTEVEQAIATTVRIMLEEHTYWGGLVWRFQYGGRETLQKVWNGETSFFNWLMFAMIGSFIRDAAWKQGMGRHSEDQVVEMLLKDMRTLSLNVGKRKYLLGDKVCEDDAAVFGVLSMSVFDEQSPFKAAYDGELKNLKDYCSRMKEEFWPDWEKRLEK